MSDFLGYTNPVARKAHRCEWCGEFIPPGEKYVRYRGVWEGEFQNWGMHRECNELYQAGDSEDGFDPFENERPEKPVLTVATIRKCHDLLMACDPIDFGEKIGEKVTPEN